ncbi:MAG: aldo/keto reductase [Myxococcales bacterium]|nr:aldo/keto reductase [Myxococcales bacterium]MCB9646274.1 aldo/keto reductase [Deltaproteobacteria bacterium]
MSGAPFSPTTLKGNRFAPLADPGVDQQLEAQRQKEATRQAAKGYTVPKLDLFGADVPPTRQDVLGKAMGAGYRAFDAASAYSSTEALGRLGQEKGIRDDLYVIYKVKPADDAAIQAEMRGKGPEERRQLNAKTVSAQLSQAKAALGRTPEVLMLHELSESDTANDKTLRQLASYVKAGHAKGLGASNLGLDDVRRLHQRARELGCRLSCVENRFSPYQQDDAVRRFCEDNDIRYLGYGLMGSTQVGACVDEGYGMPTQYLLPRLDPRLTALAEREGVSAGELLIRWAYETGVVPVTFSTDDQRIQDNLGARTNPRITPELVAEVGGLFVPLTRDELDAKERAPDLSGDVKALYGAYPDRTMWYILDQLTAEPGIATLLGDTAASIAAEVAGPEREGALRNFACNLMRHVADLQSSGAADWRDGFKTLLGAVAEAAGARPEVKANFKEWATKDATVGGGYARAQEVFAEMLAEPVQPAQAPANEIDLSAGWVAYSAMGEVVPAPALGETYTFFKQATQESRTARVDDVQGQRLTIRDED